MRPRLLLLLVASLIGSGSALADDASSIKKIESCKAATDVKDMKACIDRYVASIASGTAPSAAIATPAAKKTPTDAAPGATATTKAAAQTNSPIIVRASFPDWDFLSNQSLVAVPASQGAKVSFDRNNVTHDTTWAVKGLAAVPLIFPGDYGGLLGLQFAPYVAIDRQDHSKLVKNNTETYTAGLVGMVGFDTGTIQSYFRLRAAYIDDEIKGVNSVNSTLEWVPVSLPLGIHYPEMLVPHLQYRLDPSVIVQYDHSDSDLNPIVFSGRADSVRVGPALTLRFLPFYLPSDDTMLANLSGAISYHWDEELNSGRTYSLFTSSLTYNFTRAGNVGITASYNKGEDETTGVRSDVFDVALAIKY